MRLFKITVIIFFIFIALPALARPKKGFHEGPYVRIIGGVISSNWDNNQRTGAKTAGDYEAAFGAEFGWNLWDSAGPELQMRYATKKVRDSREHIVNLNLNIKYNLVINALTDIGGDLNILPFVQGGPSALIAAIPGDSAIEHEMLAVWGLGGSLGAGVDFLFAQYVYLGVIIQADILYIPAVRQTIGGVKQTIIGGDWEPQLGVLGMAGVHF